MATYFGCFPGARQPASQPRRGGGFQSLPASQPRLGATPKVVGVENVAGTGIQVCDCALSVNEITGRLSPRTFAQ